MSKKEFKTNAMRMLDKLKIPYESLTYECDEFVSGVSTADLTGLPHELVYKTLVTTGKTGEHYVFVIPIEGELDLKKAADILTDDFRSGRLGRMTLERPQGQENIQ